MSPITPRRAAPLVLLASFLVAAPAAAQTAPRAAPAPRTGYVERRGPDGARVIFDDDLAVAGAFDPLADIVKAPPRAARMQLLRLRTDFVQELVSAVENL